MLPKRVCQVTNLVTSARQIDRVNDAKGKGVRWLISRALQNRFESLQIHRADGVIAISNAILEAESDRFSKSTATTVIPNCIDVPRVSKLAHEGSLPEAWPRAGSVILFVGRLERRKGVDIAVEAMKFILRKDPNAVMAFAGGAGDPRVDPSLDELSAEWPDQWKARLLNFGTLSSGSLYASMRAADVVICPSRWEAFGNVALEAKACGAAIVATTGSGFDDFNENGVDSFLVDGSKPSELSHAISLLLDDVELRERFKSKALASTTCYTPSEIAGRYADFMQSVAGL